MNYIIIRRICAISLIYAVVLNYNTLIIQSIGSGLGLFSGLFEVNLISNLISIFILLISSIILLIWPNLISDSISNTFNIPRLLKEKKSQKLYYKLLNLFNIYNKGPSTFSYLIKEKRLVNRLEKGKEDNNISISNDYCLIILFNILGAIFLLNSSDLVSMYLSIELQSFALYILASLYKNKLTSTSAGLKYFLLGGLSSCIILLGSGLIYTYTGLTNIESIFNLLLTLSSDYKDLFNLWYVLLDNIDLNKNLEIVNNNLILNVENGIKLNFQYYYTDIKGIILGFIFIFVGFLFKIAASPFHNWSPDVYDDTPNIVTIWLTILPKLSILIFLLFIYLQIQFLSSFTNILDLFNITEDIIIQNINIDNILSLFNYTDFINKIFVLNNINIFNNVLTNLLLLSSLLSLVIGAIVGLKQIRIKRLLAYSTINHIGFILLALSVSSKYSVEAFTFYIIQYSITNLNIFLILLALGYLINIKINIKNEKNNSFTISQKEKENNIYYKLNLSDIEYINSLKGIFYVNPILSISFIISLFSFAGIPPLIGFFAKQQVLYASNSAGYIFISIIAIIVSVISASYYLKIIKVIITIPQKKKGVAEINKKEEQVIINKIINSELYKNILSNTHCFIIGVLTLSIILFFLNPEILLNTLSLLVNYYIFT